MSFQPSNNHVCLYISIYIYKSLHRCQLCLASVSRSTLWSLRATNGFGNLHINSYDGVETGLSVYIHGRSECRGSGSVSKFAQSCARIPTQGLA